MLRSLDAAVASLCWSPRCMLVRAYITTHDCGTMARVWWLLRSTADAIEGSGWGGPLANGVGGGGGGAGALPPLPPLTPLRATNSGIPHYDIPGGARESSASLVKPSDLLHEDDAGMPELAEIGVASSS